MIKKLNRLRETIIITIKIILILSIMVIIMSVMIKVVYHLIPGEPNYRKRCKGRPAKTFITDMRIKIKNSVEL